MSKVTKKVFLPKWQRFFVLPLISIIWLFILYQEFFSPEAGEMGIVGFVFTSVILLGTGFMTFLMTTGKLPAYIIEEEKEDK